MLLLLPVSSRSTTGGVCEPPHKETGLHTASAVQEQQKQCGGEVSLLVKRLGHKPLLLPVKQKQHRGGRVGRRTESQ